VSRLVIAVVLVAVAVLVAWLLQRRRVQPARAPTFHVPERLARADFPSPDVAWLVVVFTSATCDTCRTVAEKAHALESAAVAVHEVEARADKPLHDRYGIDAVPLAVIADRDGTVRAHFFGPVSAADLWSTLAELRDGPS
jgi:hypothetical protein